MDAYSATAWAAAFTAITSASAALTGLLFVALSINLSQVLKVPGLVPRAIEVLVPLTAVLVLSTLLLMPPRTRPRWRPKSCPLQCSPKYFSAPSTSARRATWSL